MDDAKVDLLREFIALEKEKLRREREELAWKQLQFGRGKPPVAVGDEQPQTPARSGSRQGPSGRPKSSRSSRPSSRTQQQAAATASSPRKSVAAPAKQNVAPAGQSEQAASSGFIGNSLQLGEYDDKKKRYKDERQKEYKKFLEGKQGDAARPPSARGQAKRPSSRRQHHTDKQAGSPRRQPTPDKPYWQDDKARSHATDAAGLKRLEEQERLLKQQLQERRAEYEASTRQPHSQLERPLSSRDAGLPLRDHHSAKERLKQERHREYLEHLKSLKAEEGEIDYRRPRTGDRYEGLAIGEREHGKNKERLRRQREDDYKQYRRDHNNRSGLSQHDLTGDLPRHTHVDRPAPMGDRGSVPLQYPPPNRDRLTPLSSIIHAEEHMNQFRDSQHAQPYRPLHSPMAPLPDLMEYRSRSYFSDLPQDQSSQMRRMPNLVDPLMLSSGLQYPPQESLSRQPHHGMPPPPVGYESRYRMSSAPSRTGDRHPLRAQHDLPGVSSQVNLRHITAPLDTGFDRRRPDSQGYRPGSAHYRSDYPASYGAGRLLDPGNRLPPANGERHGVYDGRPASPMLHLTGQGRQAANPDRKAAYAEELKRQMQEKNAREQAVRKKKEELDRAEDDAVYDPWGKSGAGAPNRDQTGRVVADLRQMRQTNEQGDPDKSPRRPANAAPGTDRSHHGAGSSLSAAGNPLLRADALLNASPERKTGYALSDLSNPAGPVTTADQTWAPKNQVMEYRDFLQKQIDEKAEKKRKEEERLKREEEVELERIEEEKKRLKEEYERELERQRQKEEAAKKENKALAVEKEAKRKSLSPQPASSERQPKMVSPRGDGGRLVQPLAQWQQPRGNSPPIPTLRQTQSNSPPVPALRELRGNSPPVPALRMTRADSPPVPALQTKQAPRLDIGGPNAGNVHVSPLILASMSQGEPANDLQISARNHRPSGIERGGSARANQARVPQYERSTERQVSPQPAPNIFRSSSPPVPALRKKEDGGRRSRSSRPSSRHGAARRPPSPGIIMDAGFPNGERGLPGVEVQLAEMKRKLDQEQARLERRMKSSEDQYAALSEVNMAHRHQLEHSRNKEKRLRQLNPTEIFNSALHKKRPPQLIGLQDPTTIKLGDPPLVQSSTYQMSDVIRDPEQLRKETEEFNHLKYGGESSDRDKLRQMYPNPPLSADSIDRQQKSLLRQQHKDIERLQKELLGAPRATAKVSRRFPGSKGTTSTNGVMTSLEKKFNGHQESGVDDTASLTADTEFVPLDRGLPPTSAMSQVSDTTYSSMQPEVLAERNKRRLKYLREVERDIDTYSNPLDLLQDFATRGAAPLDRVPSPSVSLRTETTFRPASTNTLS